MLQLPDNYHELKHDMNKEMVAFVDAMALKHAKIPYTLEVQITRNERKNYPCYMAMFFDRRFPLAEEVGYVLWDYGRSVNSHEYMINSRLIENAKYGAWNQRDFNSVRTKDLNKALKKAMEFIIPYQWQELANKSKDVVERAHRSWAEENSSMSRNFNFAHVDVVSELKNLMSQGVVFKTEAFKQAIGAIPLWEEYRARISKPVRMECVMYALGKVNVSNNDSAREYPNDEALPEDIRQKIGLLKLLEDKKLMPEIGYKFDANTFWIYTETNK